MTGIFVYLTKRVLFAKSLHIFNAQYSSFQTENVFEVWFSDLQDC